MSMMLLSMERPCRKPRCELAISGSSAGSTKNLTALAMRRLSVLVMDNGRTPPGSNRGSPSSVVPPAFLGKKIRRLAL
eukprot:7410468-Pyramimonas_sp.AAC.1